MKTLRIVCNFLLSLVQALFPRGLKGRHSCPGDHPSGESAGDPSATESALEEPPPATTAGNLMGWLLIGAVAVKLFC